MDIILRIILWPFVAATEYAKKAGVGLLGFLLYRGSRFVVGVFWFTAFGLAVRHRHWIERNAPVGYGAYTNVLLLVGLTFYGYWLLLPRIRTWRFQRLLARGAATTISTDETVREMKNLTRMMGKFYTDVNKFQRHISEDGIDPDNFEEGSYEQTVAEAARDAQATVERDSARGKPKRKPRKPTTEQRLANMERMMAKIAEKLES